MSQRSGRGASVAAVARPRVKWGGLVLLLGLFVGLCSVFAAILTAIEAGQEHARAAWPEVTARVETCDLALYTHKPESYYIDCSVSYPVRGERIVAHVSSRSTPAPRRVIWQSPPRQFERMQQWVDEHPRGTPIVVRHDPVAPRTAALAATDMPLGGPQTPGNLKLVAMTAAASLVLVALGRLLGFGGSAGRDVVGANVDGDGGRFG